MEEYKIEIRKTDSIIPYEKNPRINDKAVDAVAASLQQFGFRQPIVIDSNGVVIVGHTRLKAAKQLGLQNVPVHVATDLSEKQTAAYRIADNKTGEIAEWDFDILPIELSELQGSEIDMSAFGFSEKELTKLLENDLKQGQTDPNEIPELTEQHVTQKGDLWILGKHKLLCGDSTNIEDVNYLVGDNASQITLLLTDIPYNVNYSQKAEAIKKFRPSQFSYKDIVSDCMTSDDYFQFLTKVMTNIRDKVADDACFYMFCAGTLFGQCSLACEYTGWPVKQNLIWVKNNLVIGFVDYKWKHEVIMYGWKPDGGGHCFNGGHKQTTVIEDQLDLKQLSKTELIKMIRRDLQDNDSQPTTILHCDKPLVNGIHPTVKPVELLTRLIHNSTKPGDSILEPFAGSGSTIIACEQTDRTCYAIELEEKYCDVIANRWCKFTGQEAVRVKRTGERISWSPSDTNE